MSIMTFRTECKHDNQFVPNLIGQLGARITKVRLRPFNNDQTFLYGVFTIETNDECSVKEFQQRMKSHLETSTEFFDLHRCYQTLNEGDEPNVDWCLS